jgi:hypothetical protein
VSRELHLQWLDPCRTAWVSNTLQVAPEVAVVAGELPGQGEPEKRLQHPHTAAQLSLSDEMDPCSIAVGLEGPSSVDRIWALDDMDMNAARPADRERLFHLHLQTYVERSGIGA